MRPGASLFPYTTLFRSEAHRHRGAGAECCQQQVVGAGAGILAADRDGLVGGDAVRAERDALLQLARTDRKSTRLNSSHSSSSYAVFCLKTQTPRPSLRP